MAELLRRFDRLGRDLSAYLDGELVPRRRAAVLEQLTLDPATQAAFAQLSRADELARLAAAPDRRPDLQAIVGRLKEAVAARAAALPRPAAARRARPRPLLLHPAVIASAGLLVTAGVAVFQLRRRGKR